MTHTKTTTPIELIPVGPHLDLKIRNDRITFAFTPHGIIKGGEIALSLGQVTRMMRYARTRRVWESASSSDVPSLLVWWEEGEDDEPDQLIIDLYQRDAGILFGRAIVVADDAEKLLTAIEHRSRPGDGGSRE